MHLILTLLGGWSRGKESMEQNPSIPKPSSAHQCPSCLHPQSNGKTYMRDWSGVTTSQGPEDKRETVSPSGPLEGTDPSDTLIWFLASRAARASCLVCYVLRFVVSWNSDPSKNWNLEHPFLAFLCLLPTNEPRNVWLGCVKIQGI